ncbi:MAG: aminotransferase class V-fold PLP-dependent enzyme [Candidatus Coatesbacteria bacterium]|nr:aminotransferase class V-fold PLP-dependent enzyme [Candidatus Coatesbacteria bacterium]
MFPQSDFPALSQKFKNKPPIYLDNACMSLKPQQVINKVIEYYSQYPSCHGRTTHKFGLRTTEEFDAARIKAKKFLNAKSPAEIIFTKNATEALNLVSQSITLEAEESVITSGLEHNSNLLPWQELAKRTKAYHLIWECDEKGNLDLNILSDLLKRHKVKLVSLFHKSNLTGAVLPVKEISELVHNAGAWLVVDAAQSALSVNIDVQEMNCDFLALSSHKMLGPTGVGLLYGKLNFLERLPSFLVGGETVIDTEYHSMTKANLPDRFEAGLQNYAGVIGMGAAIDYIEKYGREKINSYIKNISRKAFEKLSKIDKISLIGDPEGGILTFSIRGMSSQEAARFLDESENIMVRAGKMCVHSFFNHFKHPEMLRISLAPYNNEAEINIANSAIEKIVKFFV